jgi:hypothetical protein
MHQRSVIVSRASVVVVALSLALALAALAAPAGAAKGGQPDRASPVDEKSLEIWAYFDGDTPVTGGQVRVYAGGRRLRERGDEPVTTIPGGEAMLRFGSLPSALRIVVSGGRAGGERVDGSLRAKVRSVSDGDIVEVNPVTTVTDLLGGHADDGLTLRHARNLTERTLGIKRALNGFDLYLTDRWFEGDRFLRWTLERGSVGAGARTLVRLIERPGFDRRQFDPPDGGSPKAAAAASGGASAGNVLNGLLAAAPCGTTIAKNVTNGLLDGVAGAASLTGPSGFALSLAVTFFKEVTGLALQDCGDKEAGEDPVHAALRGLSAQVTELQKRVDELKDQVEKEFFTDRVAPASEKVDAIEATQQDFLSMLVYAKAMDNKALSEQQRKDARADLLERMKNFLTGARSLAAPESRAADYLNKRLLDDQPPDYKPGLLTGFRRQVAKKRFFTHQSSEEIRSFFRYFEWAQTNLMTVLTEFYMLGGTCARDFMTNHPDKLPTENDCRPVRDTAKLAVTDIQKNIDEQRAMLPPKILDDRVFIDRNTHLMWRLRASHRTTREILDSGLRCEGLNILGCSASLVNTDTRFIGLDYPSAWNIPSASQYRDLFGGPDGPVEPLARLDSLGGVSYNGEPLKTPAYVWLADHFYLEKPNNYPADFRQVKEITAKAYTLKPGSKDLTTDAFDPGGSFRGSFTLGRNCTFPPPYPRPGGTGLGRGGAKPTCNTYDQFGAYTLWKRGPMSDAEGGDYWCRPKKQADGTVKVLTPSWDPAKC